jgi:hypothetical protein
VRVLLDESLPVDLAAALEPHEVTIVRAQGWAGLQNGELLRRAKQAFDVFVTMDRNLPHQQNLTAIGMAVVLVLAKSNRVPDLQPLVPAILDAIVRVEPGEILRVGV